MDTFNPKSLRINSTVEATESKGSKFNLNSSPLE